MNLLSSLKQLDYRFSQSLFELSKKFPGFTQILKKILKVYGVLFTLILILLYPNRVIDKFLVAVAVVFINYGLVEKGIKVLIKRRRPSYSFIKDSHSFPSSHAFSTLLLSLILIYLTPGIGIFGILLHIIFPIFVGVSRVFTGAHYFSDVVGGWGVGVLLFILIRVFLFV